MHRDQPVVVAIRVSHQVNREVVCQETRRPAQTTVLARLRFPQQPGQGHARAEAAVRILSFVAQQFAPLVRQRGLVGVNAKGLPDHQKQIGIAVDQRSE